MKIWVNGCFDVLHRGHFELFKYAKSLGNELVVGIDTDFKVSQDKGADRPYNNLQDRMFALQSIKYIDKVISFNSRKELESLISLYSPDILLVGSDWRDGDIVGKQFAREVCFFERITQYSTTDILTNERK
jgi:D-beta-D-heptose 7-phosphate kinase/D-beta-D-heptose 1-phosphate adenosyltransferase|tara:strand:+ start:1444 stop:1836 length:393 start_codon:yes stop_codon:yes gene_type:complete